MKRLDLSLVLSLITLMGVGIVQVYSSSFILATENYSDGLYFFKKQLLFTCFALVILVVTASLPWKMFEKLGWLLWVFACLGVVVTLIPGVGIKVGGAARWIQLPFGVRFEPGELLKISFAFIFASLMFDKKKKPYLSLFKVIMVIAALILLLRQPDFGTFAIICTVAVGLLFAFGLKWRYIVTSFVLAIPAFYFLVWMKDYRRARVLAFLDPWADPTQKGFQVIQSMLSFHSGGVTGAGLGQGQGKLFFLPEAHTDFTLAILGEEMGFIGFAIVLLIYGVVIFRGFQIALETKEPFPRSVALGLIMTFAFSVFINAGVVMGLLPTKGLTLPFLSYGGSSLVVFAFLFGIILNIEKNHRIKKETPWLAQ